MAVRSNCKECLKEHWHKLQLLQHLNHFFGWYDHVEVSWRKVSFHKMNSGDATSANHGGYLHKLPSSWTWCASNIFLWKWNQYNHISKECLQILVLNSTGDGSKVQKHGRSKLPILWPFVVVNIAKPLPLLSPSQTGLKPLISPKKWYV